MPERREAVGGTLVVGGGFAGAYVARLLGKQRRDDRQPRQLHALHPAAARGRGRHPRAAPRRRPAPPDVPACRAAPRASPRSRPGRAHGRRRHPRGDVRDRLRAARRRARRRDAHVPRARASPSTGAASRTSPTRSRSAITCSARSSPPPPGSTRRKRRATSGSSSSGPDMQGSRRSPSCTTSPTRPSAARIRRCAESLSGGCWSTPPRGSSPRSRASWASTPIGTWRSEGSRSG